MSLSLLELAKGVLTVAIFAYPVIVVCVFVWALVLRMRSKVQDDVRELAPLNAWQAAVYSGNRGTLATTVGLELMHFGLVAPNGRVVSTARPANLSAGAHLMFDEALKNMDGQTGLFWIPSADRFVRTRAVRQLVRQTVVELQELGYYVRKPPLSATRPVSWVWTFVSVASIPVLGAMFFIIPAGFCFFVTMWVMSHVLMAVVLNARWHRSEAGRVEVCRMVDKYKDHRGWPVSPMLVPLFGAAALVEVMPAASQWLHGFNPQYLSQFGLQHATTSEWSFPGKGTMTSNDGCGLFGSESISDKGCSSDAGDGCGGCGGCGD